MALNETHKAYQVLNIHNDGIWDMPIKEQTRPSGWRTAKEIKKSNNIKKAIKQQKAQT